MIEPILPESFIDFLPPSDPSHGAEAGTDKPPIALVIPSTRLSLDLANRLVRERVLLAVTGGSTSGITPSAILVQAGVGERPTLAIFCDQLVSAQEATILLRTDTGDFHISPFELILNQRYGYHLVIWGPDGYSTTIGYCSDSAHILQQIFNHLTECNTLGDQWLGRGDQALRTPAIRTYNARRKVRMFKSSLVAHYPADRCDAELDALLERIDSMELSLIRRLEQLAC